MNIREEVGKFLFKAGNFIKRYPYSIIIGGFVFYFGFYFNHLTKFFISDDFALFNLFTLDGRINWSFALHDFYGKFLGFADMYRPFFNVSYLINFLLGSTPYSFHLFNLLLHFASTLLVYKLALLVTKSKFIPVASSLLFLFNPLSVEAVFWITGRVDLLPTFFILLCLVLFVVWIQKGKWFYLVWSALAYLGALFSKESGLSLPILTFLIYLYYLLFVNRNLSKKELLKNTVAYVGLYSLVTVLYWGIRRVIGIVVSPTYVPSGELITNFLYYLKSIFVFHFLPVNVDLIQSPFLETLLSKKTIILKLLLVPLVLVTLKDFFVVVFSKVRGKEEKLGLAKLFVLFSGLYVVSILPVLKIISSPSFAGLRQHYALLAFYSLFFAVLIYAVSELFRDKYKILATVILSLNILLFIFGVSINATPYDRAGDFYHDLATLNSESEDGGRVGIVDSGGWFRDFNYDSGITSHLDYRGVFINNVPVVINNAHYLRTKTKDFPEFYIYFWGGSGFETYKLSDESLLADSKLLNPLVSPREGDYEVFGVVKNGAKYYSLLSYVTKANGSEGYLGKVYLTTIDLSVKDLEDVYGNCFVNNLPVVYNAQSINIGQANYCSDSKEGLLLVRLDYVMGEPNAQNTVVIDGQIGGRPFNVALPDKLEDKGEIFLIYSSRQMPTDGLDFSIKSINFNSD